jgi:NTP pyrophosphatase (non-canonical NTP hydrolase)
MSSRTVPPTDDARTRAYAEFKDRLRRFMVDRDWKKFHNPKDLAVAISLEASELLEHFLWKNGPEIDESAVSHGAAIRDEAADIGIYLMELCDVLGVDLVDAMSAKLEKAAVKYPVEKARGSNRKYTELDGR